MAHGTAQDLVVHQGPRVWPLSKADLLYFQSLEPAFQQASSAGEPTGKKNTEWFATARPKNATQQQSGFPLNTERPSSWFSWFYKKSNGSLVVTGPASLSHEDIFRLPLLTAFLSNETWPNLVVFPKAAAQMAKAASCEERPLSPQPDPSARHQRTSQGAPGSQISTIHFLKGIERASSGATVSRLPR